MSTKTIEAFNIIGISIKTTNQNQQAGKDIPALWDKFMTTNALDKIPNKIDNTIYSIYTDYEGDHTQPYTTIIGCKVSDTSSIPDGMIVKQFKTEKYTKFQVKGDLTKGLVYNQWVKIWDTNLDRTYTADFEAYGENSMDPTNAEVEIFVATK